MLDSYYGYYNRTVTFLSLQNASLPSFKDNFFHFSIFSARTDQNQCLETLFKVHMT
jgi:hypothetical protein